MACTCKEDFEQIGNVRIGRNKVECAECKTAREARDAQREKDLANAEAERQLALLDAKKVRALVDHVLGTPTITVEKVSMTPKAYLESLEGKAATERAKIRK